MKTLIALVFTILLSTSVYAQKAGPNGGLLAGKGVHETELVVTPTELTVYILHDGKPDDTKGMTLRAVIQEGGKSTTVQLVNVENQKMVGKIAAPLGKGAIVVISGKDHHGDPVTARYTIN